VFILSPANLGGERGSLILRPDAQLALALAIFIVIGWLAAAYARQNLGSANNQWLGEIWAIGLFGALGYRFLRSRPVTGVVAAAFVVALFLVIETITPGKLIGIPFAVLVWWALHRRSDPSVETTFSRGHPSAPPYVTGLTIVGATVVLVWLWFLYIYLPSLLIQLAPNVDESSWYWIGTFALFFSLPVWVVQGLAVIGLLQKHDWGAILAMLACVLWILSGVGAPFGIAGLLILWRWQHPVLMRPGRPAQGALSTGVPS